MKFLAKVAMLVASLSIFAQPNAVYAHGVKNAKAAELALHRIERLVILKKIEESFQSKMNSLTLEAIPHDNDDQPSFRATVFQHPPADGTQKTIEIIMNGDGKALKHTVNAGGEPENAPTWPDKDAVTLAENALHYVIEGSATKSELVPYNQELKKFTITDGTNSEGARVAVVDVEANDAVIKDEAPGTTSNVKRPVLRVRVKLNGTFDSTEFVPQAE